MATMNIPLHQYEPAFYSGAKVRTSEVTSEYNQITAALTIVANTIGNVGNCHSTIECTANSFAVTLPTAVGIVGMKFTVKNTGSGTITLATTSGQTIDGQSVQTLTQWQSLDVMSNNTNWVII